MHISFLYVAIAAALNVKLGSGTTNKQLSYHPPEHKQNHKWDVLSLYKQSKFMPVFLFGANMLFTIAFGYTTAYSLAKKVYH